MDLVQRRGDETLGAGQLFGAMKSTPGDPKLSHVV